MEGGRTAHSFLSKKPGGPCVVLLRPVMSEGAWSRIKRADWPLGSYENLGYEVERSSRASQSGKGEAGWGRGEVE